MGFLKKKEDNGENDGITNYGNINDVIIDTEAYKYAYPSHVTMLALNRDGLVNINRMVSESYTVTYHRTPRILKKFLQAHRSGLLIGSSLIKINVNDKIINAVISAKPILLNTYFIIKTPPLNFFRKSN